MTKNQEKLTAAGFMLGGGAVSHSMYFNFPIPFRDFFSKDPTTLAINDYFLGPIMTFVALAGLALLLWPEQKEGK